MRSLGGKARVQQKHAAKCGMHDSQSDNDYGSQNSKPCLMPPTNRCRAKCEVYTTGNAAPSMHLPTLQLTSITTMKPTKAERPYGCMCRCTICPQGQLLACSAHLPHRPPQATCLAEAQPVVLYHCSRTAGGNANAIAVDLALSAHNPSGAKQQL